MEPAAAANRLPSIPTSPGIYLFRDAQGNVLYVGKASRLRNRLRSYFTSKGSQIDKIQKMVSRAADFECILTHSEQEALILECTLIKRHKPEYNARLKDDKSYPYIKINLKEEFPLVTITRRVEKDGARYFGPYASASSVRRTLDLLKKLFPYRSCTKVITGHDPRPCLEFYIHRCVAPCIGAASKEEYREVIDQVALFLEGKTGQVVRDLTQRMSQAAEAMEFERAAIVRDQIRAIEMVSQEQKVVSPKPIDADVIAMAQSKDQAWMEVFFIRQGMVIGRDNYIMEGTQDEATASIMAQFIKQFYLQAPYIPPLLFLQHSPIESRLIQEWLQSLRGSKVVLTVPKRGEKRSLVQMVVDNAVQGLEQMRSRVIYGEDALESAMQELQDSLSLPRIPSRMECYDISNIQGTNPVGSMVVFEDGKPKKAHYRRFKIKTIAGIDDYSMMQEMLRRRFHRLGDLKAQAIIPGQPTNGERPLSSHDEAWGIIPDLVLIDGGKGHLSAALQVFLELGIDFVPLASIAKEQEELFVPHSAESILLPRNSPALFLVQRIRDEAHRFAITFHQRLRSKGAVMSAMDSVPGIGPKRKKLLLRRFGSVKGIKEAAVDDIAAVPGMTRSLAQRLKDTL